MDDLPSEPAYEFTTPGVSVFENPRIQDVGRRCLLTSLGLGLLTQAACSSRATSSSLNPDSANPNALTVAQIIETDPQFRIYSTIVRSVGLGSLIRNAHDLTLFAPTNDAFSDRPWANMVNPDLSSQGGASTFRRQQLVEASILEGAHPIAEFAGKEQNVRTLGGTIFKLNGTSSGQITLALPQPARSTGIGFAQARSPSIARLGSPIQATNGIVYPVDRIVLQQSS